MKVLVLNAGSSSQKSCLYELAAPLPQMPPEPLWAAALEWRDSSAWLRASNASGAELERDLGAIGQSEAIAALLETLWQGETQAISQPEAVAAVGHRVVHGGATYRQPARVTAQLKADLRELSELAPAHLPVNLQGIEAIERVLPQAPQVAVFDTAFHATLPAAAAAYPLPHSYWTQGVRRYGFHGISHQYCGRRAAQLLGREAQSLQLITCHLGNGASLAAIRNGRCVDTTMGYTPLEGLMMGTRSGSLDPGILIHLMRQGYDADALERLLNQESGLKGLSEVSGDMRAVRESMEQDNKQAQLAFDVYCHRLRFHIGAMLASLDRLDALVFAGGVGENVPQVRAAGCQALTCLGLQLDARQNQANPADADIAAADSPIRVLTVRTQENWAIARACWQLLSGERSPS